MHVLDAKHGLLLFLLPYLEQTFKKKKKAKICQQASPSFELKRLTWSDKESCSASSYPVKRKIA